MISIAMTTYNGEKYLKDQLDSILCQTYSDFELVVCDDCSTDSTQKILREYEKNDNRIKIYMNEKNLGFKKNFEKALFLCTGEYIAFSDQDDVWTDRKLEVCLNNIENYDFVCSNALLIDQNGKSLGISMKKHLSLTSIPDNRDIIIRHLFIRNFVQGATILARASFLQSIMPIPDSFSFHDWYIALWSQKYNGFKYIDQPLLLYRQHKKQVTEDKTSDIIALNNLEKLKYDSFFTKYSGEIDKSKKYLNNKYSVFSVCYYFRNYYMLYFDSNYFQRVRRSLKYLLRTILFIIKRK